MPQRFLIAACLAATALSGADLARAHDFPAIPPYHEHLDFNLTSPTAFTHAAGGFANPGVYSMMPGAEIEFFWTTVEDGRLERRGRWALFTALKRLGFAVVHDRQSIHGEEHSVTDYRLALSGGTRSTSFGVGFGWSGGDEETFNRENVVQLGAVRRIGRWVSVGANGTFATRSGASAGLFDLAARPLGDDRITVFGDVEVLEGVNFEHSPWSVGAMLEVPAGLKLFGRYFDDESFGVGVAYTFGGGLGQGVLRGSVSPRFDHEADHALTNWGVRLGYPERSEALESFQKNRGYLEMHLKGPVGYTRYRFFDDRRTLGETLDALEGARNDYRVAGVALNLSGARLTRGMAWEIREKLEEVRAAGKHVVVFIDEAGMSTYHVASAADRIVMDPEGLMLLPGYATGRTFVKSLFDKIGLGVEEWRFLKYKSAMESLTRHEMSEGDREQRQALVDGFYRTVRDDIASGRRVDAATVDRWIDDVTMFTAETALDEKLVDELGRWDEVKKAVEKIEGSPKRFVGPSLLANRAFPSKRWGQPPRIAVVYAIGPCEMDSGIRARRLQEILRELREDRRVNAVVVRVDSPGGSPLASDVVAREMKQIAEEKPVVVSQGEVAASGGYWLSMNAHEIVSQPTTITGSIGVIGGWVWDEGIGEKLGLEGDFVKAGEHADLFFSLRPPYVPLAIPHRAVTDPERERVLTNMRALYDDFVASVSASRKKEKEDIEAIAQGRVWTGVEAETNGLVDRLGGLHTALAVARQRAGIGPGEEAEVVERSPIGRFRFPLPTRTGAWEKITLAADGIERFVVRWLEGGADAPRADAEDAADETAFLADYDLMYLRALVEHFGRPLCLLPPEDFPREAAGPTE